MKQTVYKSEFKTGPDATKRQQMLFAADTEFAFSENYEFIEDSEGTIFGILDPQNLVELESEDELLADPEEVEMDPEDDDDEVTIYISLEEPEKSPDNCHAIDMVINNTLRQNENLRPEQVDVMFRLISLKRLMKEVDDA